MFILSYAVFLSFIFTVLALPDSPFVDDAISGSGLDSFDPPSCVLSGTFLDVFGIVFCGLGYIGFFFTLMSISSTYALLGSLLLTPLVITLGWIIAEWLRGAV